MGKLVFGNAQLLGEDFAVAGGLIEHVDEVAVFKDVLDFIARQQVFDVLRDPGRDAAPLAESLPDFHGVSRRLFFLEKQ